MRAPSLVLLALLLSGCGGGGGGGGAGGGSEIVVEMQPIGGSGITGTATLEPKGEQTNVTLELQDPTGGTGDPQVAHIHNGTCANLGDIAYPLPDVWDGISGDTFDVSLDELREGDYAVNVHRSAAKIDEYTACGDIE
jgi:CHRD domain